MQDSRRPIRRAAVLLGTASLLTLGGTAQAQDADDPALELAEVVVTGTRVQERSRLDTLAPVDVVTNDALQGQGSTELAQALSTAAPSLNFPRPAITDGTDHIRPATLRGLAPDQALVLVNSKRRHQSALVNVNGSIGRGSAAVDLNAIPIAAIERVEVLRDGASAQYGSDAIAGVINLQLRKASSGGGAAVTFGEYSTDVEAARGSRSASDGQTITASVWTGLPLGTDGFLTLTGEYRDRDPTSRGDLDPRDPRTAADITNGVARPPLSVTSRYGDPESQDLTFYANAGIPLANDWELYGWAGLQQRDGESAAFPRLRNNVNNDITVYPNGFLPIIASDIKDYTLAFGARGALGSWDTDISLVYGINQLDYRTENSLNGTIRPSPTSFDSGGLEYDQLTFNAGIVRGIDWIGVKPTNVAFGLEARRETYAITAGELASYNNGGQGAAGAGLGAQGFPGFQPGNEVDEDRTAVGVYADIEAQVTDRFLASAAARAEDYSDFGSNVTGKLSARFDFTESFALRSTVSTGFRAPGLQQSFFTSTATNFISGIPFEVGTFPATSSVARALGASDLDAEESQNYSLGAVFRTTNFELTVDAYRIDIDDRIVLSENLGGTTQVDNLIRPFGIGRARFFINGVDTTTEGVDLVSRYKLRTEKLGRFDFTLSANWNSTEITRLPSTNVLATICTGQPPGCVAPALFARINQVTFEEGTPSDKQTLAVDWTLPVSYGEWGVGLKATNYGSIVDPQTAPVADILAGAATIVDLELRAKFGEGFSASVGADNLLDKYPTPSTAAQNTTGARSFTSFSPFGFNGRFLYARLGYQW